MATINAAGVHIFRALAEPGSPVSITPSWNSRLAGTAYVEANPMVGVVIALALDGPTLVGVTDVNNDGTFEITGVAQKYANTDLLVFGISRTPTDNIAVVGHIRTVA